MWLQPVGPGLIIFDHGGGEVILQVLNAVSTSGVIRKDLRRLALGLGHHVVPKLDALARVKAGAGHEVFADEIGFALLSAAEGKTAKLTADA